MGKKIEIIAYPAPDDAGCSSTTKDCFGYTWIITCPNPAKQSLEK